MKFERAEIISDVLIIGGGAAGCFCALALGQESQFQIAIVDKANIERSGCLAAGVNALNAYIGAGETAESFVDYVSDDSEGIVREDLVYSIAKRLNKVTQKLEKMGLPILKDQMGSYIQRGKRSIKINGEAIKPLLARGVEQLERTQVYGKINIVNYLVKDGRVVGAIGVSYEKPKIYVFRAKAIVCATGGASGIYKPNNPGFSKHKMWYSPFNTGGGYGMGIRAGAEMTSFEMRFIALRIKNSIAPTGTIAQGIGAQQINRKGEPYVAQYGKPTTSSRLYATVEENKVGNGPCYLKTEGIDEETESQLYKAYLNMAPAQVLMWVENKGGPRIQNVPIEGTEPYIVGGHTGSGYWVDHNRETTLKGLFAIGDVAGGSPKKYVTGCFAEGEIVAEYLSKVLHEIEVGNLETCLIQSKIDEVVRCVGEPMVGHNVSTLEEEMQEVMDCYGGGIKTGYSYNQRSLEQAKVAIDKIMEKAKGLKINTLYELQQLLEVKDRLVICQVVLAHLGARKETRWRSYQQNEDYPDLDDLHFKCYINSVYEQGRVKVFKRDLVGRDVTYEHQNS